MANLTKRNKKIVVDLVDAHRAFLSADERRQTAGEAYINAFGQSSHNLFRLSGGDLYEVDVPSNEFFYPEVSLHEAAEILDV